VYPEMLEKGIFKSDASYGVQGIEIPISGSVSGKP
jgi:hypothetical protein